MHQQIPKHPHQNLSNFECNQHQHVCNCCRLVEVLRRDIQKLTGQINRLLFFVDDFNAFDGNCGLEDFSVNQEEQDNLVKQKSFMEEQEIIKKFLESEKKLKNKNKNNKVMNLQTPKTEKKQVKKKATSNRSTQTKSSTNYKKSKYTLKQKFQAVKYVYNQKLKGWNIPQASEVIGITSDTIRRWRAQLEGMGPAKLKKILRQDI